jgi:UDP:flavonoid glycosyltransferase YjiC (YdhE family)
VNAVVATIGSRGDVQPYINLCQALQEARHQVVLATNPTLCRLAESHGVTAAPVGPAVDMGAAGAELMRRSFDNMWIGMIRVMRLGARLVQEAYPDVLKVCRGADLIITSDTGSGIVEAETLGIPWISVTLQPARIPLPGQTLSIPARALWAVLGRIFVAPTNRFRRHMGVPPVPDVSSLMSGRLILLPVSRHVAAPDPRWPRTVRQTGYWYPRADPRWKPPSDLLEFLSHDEKPLAVSMGVMSMSGKQAQRSARIVIAALTRAKRRAIIQGWDEPLRAVELPPTIYHAGAMPHAWLFEQVAAVIHHGGFGTTAAVLRAGVPGIVVPHVIDQFYWGQRVAELGVGPQFISRGKLKVESLSEAILRVEHDRAMRERAAALGREIQAEGDGLVEAVRALEGAK